MLVSKPNTFQVLPSEHLGHYILESSKLGLIKPEKGPVCPGRSTTPWNQNMG